MSDLEAPKKRGEIDAKYKWKLEDIYQDNAQWEKEYEELQHKLPDLEALRETLTTSAEELARGLREIDRAGHILERLFVYAKMRKDEDNANPFYQALTDRATSLSVRYSAAVSYVSPLILTIEEETLRRWMEDCQELKDYRFMLKDLLRGKEHVLDAQQEKLLSLAGDFAGGAKEIFTMLNNADMQFDSVEYQGQVYPLSHATYIALMQSPDRELRKKVFTTYYKSFKDQINTIAATYATSVKKDVFYARARKYDSALKKALFGDNVPEEVYHGLIQSIHQNLPSMYRYVELRKRILGLDQIEMYDIYAPLVADVKNDYPYFEAIEIVRKALAPLGQDYIETLDEAFRTGWVDVMENQGKTSGAYSWGVYGVHPYVLLNHRGDLDSVFTIAHEMGHAMHSYYSNKTQPYPLAGYTIFVAEVASTVNEILLTRYLLKTVEDKALRAYVLNHYIDQFRTTVVRQTMFAEFERKTHEMAEQDEPLTADSLSKVYGDLNREYYGPAMGDDDTISLEWARIPHFYNAFYVYKYATGFSSAMAIVNNLEKPGMREAYRRFLSSGGSDYPIALLEGAGVDFSQAVNTCMQEFDRALGEIEALLG